MNSHMQQLSSFVLLSSTGDVLLHKPDSIPLWRFPSLDKFENDLDDNSWLEIFSSLFGNNNNHQSQISTLKSTAKFIGQRQIPSFDVRGHESKFFFIYGENINNIRQKFPKGNENTTLWFSVDDALDQFTKNSMYFQPDTLQILKNIHKFKKGSDFDSSKFVDLCLSQSQAPHPEQQSPLEYAPGWECIPLPSETLKPFSHTNLITFRSQGSVLFVDPSPSLDNSQSVERLKYQLARVKEHSKELTVFITHHHHDHVEGLPVVEQFFPNAIVTGHELTLQRVHTNLKKVPLGSNSKFTIGGETIEFLYTPGHTDGHGMLYHPSTGVLVAGDHIVGFGSAVLDLECGDMSQYFETTHQLIQLAPRVALPEHGPPNYNPVSLLKQYIEHRTLRENAIYEAYMNGHHSLDDIVKVVYVDVPPVMWNVAKSNVGLHLRKLQKDGKIPSSVKL